MNAFFPLLNNVKKAIIELWRIMSDIGLESTTRDIL